jgi:hypothetical protein
VVPTIDGGGRTIETTDITEDEPQGKVDSTADGLSVYRAALKQLDRLNCHDSAGPTHAEVSVRLI